MKTSLGIVLLATMAAAQPARPISDAQFSGRLRQAEGMLKEQAREGRDLPAVAGQDKDAKVEITSFVYADSRTRAAELCGKVTSTHGAATSIVRVAVDPNKGKPGIYNVLAGGDGLFCATVVTYTGTATASLVGQPAAATDVVLVGQPRIAD